ncbi:MAG: right-handed parallel beta-helix repeat-containing protein, partial [Armatimonadota bacterium]
MRRVLAVLFTMVAVLGIVPAVSARIIRVNPKGYSVFDGPGDHWYNAYYTIGEALAVALPGDELWLRGMVFTENITIPSGVAVYGGFIGTETALSQRPTFPRPSPDDNATVIDGVGTAHTSIVTFPSGATSSTRLDGVTLRSAGYGGVYVETLGNPIIINNTLSNCRSYRGGGIYIKSGATPLITSNTISGCSATRGGGIYVENSLPTITGNILRDNRASCSSGDGDLEGSGGGIYVWSSTSGTPLIARNTISGNTAYHKGGGIMCAYSNVLISGNMIYNNGAADGNAYSVYRKEEGGGIYCTDSTVVITNNTMCWNGAAYGGGAICLTKDFSTSSATINGNIFYNNQASVGLGWAIYNKTTTDEVHLDYNDAYSTYVTNSYHNVTPGPHEMYVDPKFVNYNFSNPDYHLAIGSPCLNAGYSSAPGLQTTDIDGQARINGPAPDMGCDEYQMAISALANDTPVWQTAVPGLYWFQVLSGKWTAVGIAPTVDHDLRAADNAWMSPVYASSAYGGSTRDFIVANGQSFGDAAHYAQVYYGDMGSHLIEADWNSTIVVAGGSVSGAVTAGEVVDVYQSSLLSGKTYQFNVHVTSGTPDLSVFVFKPSNSSGSRFTADWGSQSGGAGVDEQLYAITAESGTYGIIVVNEDTTPGSYTVSITEKAPVTISGHLGNFAGANMGRLSVQANNGGGSDTTDMAGNYTLTVPYYWSGSVSTARSGWAFAPSSLAYTELSNNITGANFTGGQVTSIGGTKALPDGRSVYLSDKPVTATFGTDVYIEDVDRAGGIRVVGAAPPSTSVTIGGVLATADGERRIISPVIIGSGSSTVTPVTIRNGYIGGATVNYAPGIPGTAG